MSEMTLRRVRRRRGERLPMGHLLDFVAIYFETADSSRASICSAGVAEVRNGAIAMDSSVLVNPENEFSRYNSAVNGIGPQDVLDSETFPAVWELLAPLLDGGLVCGIRRSSRTHLIP